MTVIVGFHAGDFVMVGADCRLMEPNGTYSDDKEKVLSIPLGVIASSGSVGFGDLVTYMMSRTDQPRNLRPFIQRAFADMSVNAEPGLRDQLYRFTSWLMSYREGGELILSVSHPSRDHAELRISRADFAFLPPQGMTDDDETGLTVLLHQRTTELCALDEPITAKMERFAQLIEFVVKQCAQCTVTVGPTFQLGLHASDGLVQISNLMPSLSECRWHPAVRDCN